MTTRLNKTNRASIVEAIYKASDLPAREKEMLSLARTEATRLTKASVPADFVLMTIGRPKDWFFAINSVYVSSYPRSKDITKKVHGSIAGDRIHFDDPILVPRTHNMHEVADALVDWLLTVHSPVFLAWQTDCKELYQSAYATANAFRTVEALLKAAPELKPFVPNANYPVPMVPVSNAIANFLKRGVALAV